MRCKIGDDGENMIQMKLVDFIGLHNILFSRVNNFGLTNTYKENVWYR